MKTNPSRLLVSACKLASLLVIASLSHAQVPYYNVRFVGDGTPAAINDQGHVAGNDGGRAWFADTTSGLQLLPLPEGATSSVARDVNDSDWVVGQASGTGFGKKAVIWKPAGPGSWSVTVVPSPSDADATGVNDLGDVVGGSWEEVAMHSTIQRGSSRYSPWVSEACRPTSTTRGL